MNIPIWTGTSTFAVGQTPFGFYDNNLDFKTDADKVNFEHFFFNKKKPQQMRLFLFH